MTTLTLCIPAYNAAAYLPTLLIAAKSQKIPFDEILVYDDCSTDDTASIVNNFGVTLIRGDVNKGCSTGKNTLASVAKSEWLHFHDADDLILPNFTEVAHRWIKKEDAPDIVLLHYQYQNFINGESLGEPDYNTNAMHEDTIKFSIENKLVNFALIKKTAFIKIGGFDTDPSVLYNEDRAFYTRAAFAGLSFDYEKENTCINYYHPNSMSAGNISKCAVATTNVWKKVIEKAHGKYNKEIAAQLLQNANYAATGLAWPSVRESIKIARGLHKAQLPAGSGYFKLLYKILPFNSFYMREKLFRMFTDKRKRSKK